MILEPIVGVSDSDGNRLEIHVINGVAFVRCGDVDGGDYGRIEVTVSALKTLVAHVEAMANAVVDEATE